MLRCAGLRSSLLLCSSAARGVAAMGEGDRGAADKPGAIRATDGQEKGSEKSLATLQTAPVLLQAGFALYNSGIDLLRMAEQQKQKRGLIQREWALEGE